MNTKTGTKKMVGLPILVHKMVKEKANRQDKTIEKYVEEAVISRLDIDSDENDQAYDLRELFKGNKK